MVPVDFAAISLSFGLGLGLGFSSESSLDWVLFNRAARQFLCPISMDIMQDPVVVGGSGNTYDRKSIEKHFQHCHRDPLNNMELRRPQDRKLIPNNQLRSQIRVLVKSKNTVTV